MPSSKPIIAPATARTDTATASDQIFRPLDPSDFSDCQEPAWTKKLQKGDAMWTTSKIMLGWLVDTIAKTITLPLHQVERLHAILDSVGRSY